MRTVQVRADNQTRPPGWLRKSKHTIGQVAFARPFGLVVEQARVKIDVAAVIIRKLRSPGTRPPQTHDFDITCPMSLRPHTVRVCPLNVLENHQYAAHERPFQFGEIPTDRARRPAGWDELNFYSAATLRSGCLISLRRVTLCRPSAPIGMSPSMVTRCSSRFSVKSPIP